MPEPWEKLEAELRQVPLPRLTPRGRLDITRRLQRQRTGVLVRWAAGAAVAAAAVVVVTIYLATRVEVPETPRGPQLAAGWRIAAVGDAAYRVLGPDRVRLERGELRVASAEAGVARGTIHVETPVGTATADGTEFYIGTHVLLKPQERKGTTMNRLTRILVLAGAVTLATPLGSVTGGAGDLLAAETGQAPVQHAVQANSDFAFDCYHQLAKENAGKNLFFSPYSISSALAMTAEGARGPTAMEMGKVLRFPAAARRVGGDAQLIPWRTALIHTGMGALNDRLTGKDASADKAARAEIARLRKAHQAAQARAKELRAKRNWREYRKAAQEERQIAAKLNKAAGQVDQYELRIANALWGEKTYPFEDSYIKTIAKHYKTGGVFPCDFKNNFPAERARINKWVEDLTNNRIKDLIPELSPQEARLLRLVLVNAIYFKGEWATPFKEANTKPLDFALANGKKVQTPIMSARNYGDGQYAAFNADGSYFKTARRIRRGQKTGLYPPKSGFALLELPYKGDDLSMVLVAPNSPGGLAALEKKLTAEGLAAWIGKLQKRKVHVYVPKFKMETKYQLNKTLKSMGMVRAFTDPRSPVGADFTGMCASTDPRLRLYITKVLHKAFVEVNEKGTEAAAATAVMMAVATAMPMDVPFTPTFKADRPFLFVIRDKKTNSILFMGRMTNPTQK